MFEMRSHSYDGRPKEEAKEENERAKDEKANQAFHDFIFLFCPSPFWQVTVSYLSQLGTPSANNTPARDEWLTK